MAINKVNCLYNFKKDFYVNIRPDSFSLIVLQDFQNAAVGGQNKNKHKSGKVSIGKKIKK